MTAISCRICGSIEGNTFEANGFLFRKCGQCGAILKQITLSEYQALNPTYDPGAFLESRNRAEIEAYLGVPDKTRHVEKFAAKFLENRCSGRRFLDIGCGMGVYLLAAKGLGFDVTGFEPSANHAHIALHVLKLPVVNDYFSTRHVGEKLFDFIMLSHVIEHIYDQNAFLDMLSGVLKPNGILVVITPNSRSLIAQLTGKRWAMLKPVDHVAMVCSETFQYFKLQSLAVIHNEWSEHPHEPAASVLASLRDWFRHNSPAAPACDREASVPGPRVLKDPGWKGEVLKTLLTIVSFPLHLAAIVSRRQACLTCVLIKKA